MKPIIALSMGDPAGIGPEIIVKALAKPETAQAAAVIVAGDAEVLRAAMEFLGCRSFGSTAWRSRPGGISGRAYSM